MRIASIPVLVAAGLALGLSACGPKAVKNYARVDITPSQTDLFTTKGGTLEREELAELRRQQQLMKDNQAMHHSDEAKMIELLVGYMGKNADSLGLDPDTGKRFQAMGAKLEGTRQGVELEYGAIQGEAETYLGLPSQAHTAIWQLSVLASTTLTEAQNVLRENGYPEVLAQLNEYLTVGEFQDTEKSLGRLNRQLDEIHWMVEDAQK